MDEMEIVWCGCITSGEEENLRPLRRVWAVRFDKKAKRERRIERWVKVRLMRWLWVAGGLAGV